MLVQIASHDQNASHGRIALHEWQYFTWHYFTSPNGIPSLHVPARSQWAANSLATKFLLVPGYSLRTRSIEIELIEFIMASKKKIRTVCEVCKGLPREVYEVCKDCKGRSPQREICNLKSSKESDEMSLHWEICDGSPWWMSVKASLQCEVHNWKSVMRSPFVQPL